MLGLSTLMLIVPTADAQSIRPAEAAMDTCMVRALRHMDGFHADSSLFWINEGMRIAQGRKDTLTEYFFLANRAEVLYYQGLFNPALDDLDRGMVLARALGDSLLVSNVLNLRGLLHENIADSRTSITLFREALSRHPGPAVAPWPVTGIFHIHGNLANAFFLLGEVDSAAYHAERSLAFATQWGDKRAQAIAHTMLGRVALREGRADEALAALRISERQAMEALDLDVVLDDLSLIAEAHIAKADPVAARAALDSGLVHADRYADAIGSSGLRDLHRRASILFQELGDPRAALREYSAWHRLDSSITAGNMRTALATQAELLRADAELRLHKEQAEQDAATIERERQLKVAWTSAALILLLALVAIYFIDKEKRRQRERLAEMEMEGLRQEALIAELRVREQVGRDMHDDLGAGLSALKLRSEMALRVEKDPQQREQLSGLASTAGELIGSMRQIIWALTTDQASVEDLVVYTTNYMRLYCEQHGLVPEVITTDRWPDLQLTSEQRRNIFLVVKEALHNVVKHADASHVRLVMQWSDGLSVKVEDDGLGLPSRTQHSVGNGLRNMRKRIDVLGGTLVAASGAGSSGERPGTRIRVDVPLHGNQSSIAGRAQHRHLRHP